MGKTDFLGNGFKRVILFAACMICFVASALEYPSYIPDDDAVRGKFDDWADRFGLRDEEGIFEEAFLLNCSPDAVDEKCAQFRITSITKDEDGEWVVLVFNPETESEVGNGEECCNGYINIKSFTPEGADETKIKFFKAFLQVLPDEW